MNNKKVCRVHGGASPWPGGERGFVGPGEATRWIFWEKNVFSHEKTCFSSTGLSAGPYISNGLIPKAAKVENRGCWSGRPLWCQSFYWPPLGDFAPGLFAGRSTKYIICDRGRSLEEILCHKNYVLNLALSFMYVRYLKLMFVKF